MSDHRIPPSPGSLQHSGLEVDPRGIEHVQPGLEPVLKSYGWGQHAVQPYTPTASGYAGVSEKPQPELQKRILGLSVKGFWIAVFALVVILAAGIGGGVGGGLAAHNRSESSAAADAKESPKASSDGSTPPPATTATSPESFSSSPATSETPTTLTTLTTSTSTSPTTSSAPATSSQAVSARKFTIWSEVDFGGTGNSEERPNDSTCWNLNGKGDQASSVSGDSGCTTFFRDRDCQGFNWRQVGDAGTVPAQLENHIYSFRNQC